MASYPKCMNLAWQHSPLTHLGHAPLPPAPQAYLYLNMCTRTSVPPHSWYSVFDLIFHPEPFAPRLPFKLP